MQANGLLQLHASGPGPRCSSESLSRPQFNFEYGSVSVQLPSWTPRHLDALVGQRALLHTAGACCVSEQYLIDTSEQPESASTIENNWQRAFPGASVTVWSLHGLQPPSQSLRPCNTKYPQA